MQSSPDFLRRKKEQLSDLYKLEKERALSNKKIFASETCCICMDASADVVLELCMHSSTCRGCNRDWHAICPLCRSTVVISRDALTWAPV
jgi:hypothetical protein